MEEQTNIKYRIVSINNEKTVTIPEDIDVSGLAEESLQFQYKIGSVVKLSDNIITVIPSVRYVYGGSVVFESSAEFIYSVFSLEAVMDVDRENKKLNMKVDLFPTLLSAAFNSLRGIVYARTLGTPLEKYPVPLVDINALLSKNGISVEE